MFLIKNKYFINIFRLNEVLFDFIFIFKFVIYIKKRDWILNKSGIGLTAINMFLLHLEASEPKSVNSIQI